MQEREAQQRSYGATAKRHRPAAKTPTARHQKRVSILDPDALQALQRTIAAEVRQEPLDLSAVHPNRTRSQPTSSQQPSAEGRHRTSLQNLITRPQPRVPQELAGDHARLTNEIRTAHQAPQALLLQGVEAGLHPLIDSGEPVHSKVGQVLTEARDHVRARTQHAGIETLLPQTPQVPIEERPTRRPSVPRHGRSPHEQVIDHHRPPHPASAATVKSARHPHPSPSEMLSYTLATQRQHMLPCAHST